MVTVFSSMKPKDAAARMTILEDSVRLPIAAKMKERTLSLILANMLPSDAKVPNASPIASPTTRLPRARRRSLRTARLQAVPMLRASRRRLRPWPARPRPRRPVRRSMSLRAILRTGVAAACIVSVAAPSVYAAGPVAAARGSLDVRVAQAAEFSRLEFHWAGGARMTSRREGQVLTFRFNRDANPDLSTLRLNPPRWIKSAEARRAGGALEIIVTLADDADARIGNADGADFVNIFARAGATAEAAPAPVPVAPVGRPNPMPPGGVVRAGFEKAEGQARLVFNWAAPAGAAVFRRGDAVWVVFDTPARLDLSKIPASGPHFSKVQVFKGADYSAVRISTPVGTPYYAEGQGGLGQ